MKLRDLLHVLWANSVSVMAPEMKAEKKYFETFRGKANGLDSAISCACEKYGERYVDCILFTDQCGVTVSLF